MTREEKRGLTMASDGQIKALLERMRAMSAADISVLEASANTADSNMTTAPGSANEALWSEFVKFDWMIKKEDAIDLPGGKRFLITIYSISPNGLQPIRELLSTLAQQ
jgi:hypothetical protein